MVVFRVGNKGQVFSPDLIIAVGVFIFALILFFDASNLVFSRVNQFDQQKTVDSIAHMIINGLILSPGSPNNWEFLEISQVNSFGLASSNNIIDVNKFIALKNDMLSDSNYLLVKGKMGVGGYDLYFRLADSDGTTISLDGSDLEGGRVAGGIESKFSYKRIVLFNNSEAVFEVLISS